MERTAPNHSVARKFNLALAFGTKHFAAMQQAISTGESGQRIILEAIVKRRWIRARYNGAAMELAPHQLFERHGNLIVAAFNPAKGWRSAEEYRLGNFMLKGLADLTLSELTFEPLPDTPPPPRADDKLVLGV